MLLAVLGPLFETAEIMTDEAVKRSKSGAIPIFYAGGDHRCWQLPFDRIPTHGRWGRMLLAVREVILLFMYALLTVANPGYKVWRDTNYTVVALEATRDAYALDCRIRSAIESFDLLQNGAQGSAMRYQRPPDKIAEIFKMLAISCIRLHNHSLMPGSV
eukprot:6488856-Pyramimonas_sp.AAC.1